MLLPCLQCQSGCLHQSQFIKYYKPQVWVLRGLVRLVKKCDEDMIWNEVDRYNSRRKNKRNVLLSESLTSSQITYDDSDKKTRQNDLLHISGIGKSTMRAEKVKTQSSRSTSCKIHHRYAARGASSCTGVNSNSRTRNYSEFKHTRLQGRQGLVYKNDAQELGH